MTELFAHKQIRCEYCEFEFSFTGFSSAAKIVCPACGGENVLPSSPQTPAAPPVSEEPQPESPEVLPQAAIEKPVLCSVEHCPLLTGNESGNARVGKAIAEQMGLRLLHKKKQRWTILMWTVTLQVCVLLGATLFIAKALWIPQEIPAHTVAVNTETPTEPTHVDARQPAHAVVQPALLGNTPPPNYAPNYVSDFGYIAPSVEPENIVSPHEMAQDMFSPLVYDPSLMPTDPPITAPNMLSAAPGYASEATLPPPPFIEPVATLDMADDLLESAKATLTTAPENSVNQAVRAAKIYEQYGQMYPDSIYWILGNAFASLSWGESLLESSPAVETMTLSSDSRWLLTQLKDRTVWLLDLQSPANDRTEYLLDPGTAEYVKFVFSPDLRWIIGGQKNGTIRIWDMSLKNPVGTVVTFTERVPDLQDLQISPNGQWLAAFGRSPLHIALSGNILPGQKKPGQLIQQVNYQRPDRFDTADSSPYPVLLWNLRQMEAGGVPMAIAIPSMPQPVQVICFSPNSDRIAVGRRDAIVRVYDLMARGVNDDPFVLRGHQLGVTQIAFAPNGQWIATGSQDNTVCLWNLASSKFAPESATLYGHIGWISTLTIDQSGEYIFSGSYDRTIRIWNVKDNRIGTALKEEPIILETNLGVPESLFITRDGDKIIALGKEGGLGIYHLPSILGHKPMEDIRAVTFRNSRLSISKCLLTSDDQLLIFSYDHLTNPSNNGIRLWALQPQSFVP